MDHSMKSGTVSLMNRTLNMSEHENMSYAYWKEKSNMLWKVGAPIIFVLGFPGNCMVICILSSISKTKNMTSYVLLTALAVSDTLIQMLSLVPVWIEAQFETNTDNWSVVTCLLGEWFRSSLELLSTFFVTSVTVCRAVDVVGACNTANSWKPINIAITVQTIVAFALNGFFPFVRTYSMGTCGYTETYKVWGKRTFHIIHPIVYTIVPFIIMSISNAILIRAVVQSTNRMKSHTSIKEASYISIHSKLTILVLVISCMFLALTLPKCVTQLYVGHHAEDAKSRYLTDVSMLIWQMSSASHFYLFSLTAKFFRKRVIALMSMMWEICRKPGTFAALWSFSTGFAEINQRTTMNSSKLSFPVVKTASGPVHSTICRMPREVDFVLEDDNYPNAESISADVDYTLEPLNPCRAPNIRQPEDLPALSRTTAADVIPQNSATEPVLPENPTPVGQSSLADQSSGSYKTILTLLWRLSADQGTKPPGTESTPQSLESSTDD